MELRGVLESGDVAEIKAKTDALQEASRKLAEAIYAQASAQPRGTVVGRRPQQRSDDEVIEDADYEVVDERGGRRRLERVDELRPSASRRRRASPSSGAGADRRVDELAEAIAPARRVPRRAPAAEGRVRQLPQAGGARPGATCSRARPSGS